MRSLLWIVILALSAPAFGQTAGQTPTPAEKAAIKEKAAADAKYKCLMFPSTCKPKKDGKKR
jgi:hypothetical protein